MEKIPPIEIEGPTIVSDSHNEEYRFYKVSYIKTPLICRPIDEWLIKPIFEEREYATPMENFSPRFILDCGANIGTSALFFANVYPAAKIIAIEPDPDNFKLLKLNTSHYPNVKCINAALWDKETKVDIFGTHPSALRTYETADSDENTIGTTTVAKLLTDSGFDEIDLLKIDIEGAEKEVFSAADVHDWLSKTKVVAIELHDRYKFGCSKAVFSAVSKYDFFFYLNGENLFFIREELILDVWEQHENDWRDAVIRSGNKIPPVQFLLK